MKDEWHAAHVASPTKPVFRRYRSSNPSKYRRNAPCFGGATLAAIDAEAGFVVVYGGDRTDGTVVVPVHKPVSVFDPVSRFGFIDEAAGTIQTTDAGHWLKTALGEANAHYEFDFMKLKKENMRLRKELESSIKTSSIRTASPPPKPAVQAHQEQPAARARQAKTAKDDAHMQESRELRRRLAESRRSEVSQTELVTQLRQQVVELQQQVEQQVTSSGTSVPLSGLCKADEVLDLDQNLEEPHESLEPAKTPFSVLLESNMLVQLADLKSALDDANCEILRLKAEVHRCEQDALDRESSIQEREQQQDVASAHQIKQRQKLQLEAVEQKHACCAVLNQHAETRVNVLREQLQAGKEGDTMTVRLTLQLEQAEQVAESYRTQLAEAEELQITTKKAQL